MAPRSASNALPGTLAGPLAKSSPPNPSTRDKRRRQSEWERKSSRAMIAHHRPDQWVPGFCWDDAPHQTARARQLQAEDLDDDAVGRRFERGNASDQLPASVGTRESIGHVDFMAACSNEL